MFGALSRERGAESEKENRKEQFNSHVNSNTSVVEAAVSAAKLNKRGRHGRHYNIFSFVYVSYIADMVTIETIKNGPYIVKGEVELMDADGNKFAVEPRMALCRCGASTEKPFCDGTHSKIGFKAAEKAVPESKE